MTSPWLTIPLEDYESHMKSEAVQQLDALGELFAQALAYSSPESVAVLGVAGGNGLERIDPQITRRVCGIDVNPAYLQAVEERFESLPGLELYCVNLAEQKITLDPVRLVHAALVFEHAGIGCCLESAEKLVEADGWISVVLQLPSSTEEGLGREARASLQGLRQHFRLIDPALLTERLALNNFRLEREVTQPLASGKGFWMGMFKRYAA